MGVPALKNVQPTWQLVDASLVTTTLDRTRTRSATRAIPSRLWWLAGPVVLLALLAAHMVVVVLPGEQELLIAPQAAKRMVQVGDPAQGGRHNCTKFPACGVVLNPSHGEVVLQRHSGNHAGCSPWSSFVRTTQDSSWSIWKDTDCVSIPDGDALYFPDGLVRAGNFMRIHTPVVIIRL